MKHCHCCGNAYENCFDVIMDGATYSFDSFECAVHSLAPTCAWCGCRILGHGVQADDQIYCCAHCSRAEGVRGVVDHVE